MKVRLFPSLVSCSLLFAACGDSSPADRPGEDDASTGDGDSDGGERDGEQLGCELECGPHGACAQGQEAPRCICDPGYAGASCDACAPGFGRASDASCVAVLSRTKSEPAGDVCPAGGLAALSGLDADADGKLDDAEVTDSTYVCSPATPEAPAFLVQTRPEPRGAQCAQGGTATLRGHDLDGNAALDESEVESIDYACTAARVRSGTVNVGNRAELDDLIGVTEITGDLVIQNSNVLDLSPLSSLSRVGGSLNILGNGALTDLSGLAAVTEVGGDLKITDNPQLARVEGLAALRRVTGEVRVQGNALLSAVDLGSLTTIGGALVIQDNAQLSSIAGHALISVVGNLIISGHPGLTSLAGLTALDAVGGALRIEGNTALASLAGLGALTDVGALLVGSNTALTTLDALSALRTVRGQLAIGSNGLTALDGFPALVSVSGELVIRDESSLKRIKGFGKLTQVGSIFFGSLHALSSLDGFGALTSLSASSSCDPYYPWLCSYGIALQLTDLPRLQSIDAFGALELISGPLFITDLPKWKSGQGFGALASVTGELSIDQTGLEALPFVALTSVGRLTLSHNDALTSLAAFDALSTAGIIEIAANQALVEGGSFASLSSLGQLDVHDNDALTSLPRMLNLGSLSSGLRVRRNAALEQLNGLVSLTSIAPGYDVTGPDLNGISSVALQVADNPALASIEFAQQVSLSGGLVVSGNAVLDTLDLSAFLSPGQVWVWDNAALTELDLASRALYALQVSNCAHLESVVGFMASSYATLRLSNLAKLTEFTGDTSSWSGGSVTLSDCPALTDLSALSSLSSADELTLEGLPALTALPFAGTLSISRLTLEDLGITDLDGLDGLTEVNSSLLIKDNQALTSLQGLSVVGQLGRVAIEGNPALTSLAGFGTYGVDTLIIQDDDALEQLTGLESLGYVNYLTIQGNASLKSLAGFGAPVNYSMSILNNKKLPECAAQELASQYCIYSYYPYYRYCSSYISGNDTKASCN